MQTLARPLPFDKNPKKKWSKGCVFCCFLVVIFMIAIKRIQGHDAAPPKKKGFFGNFFQMLITPLPRRRIVSGRFTQLLAVASSALFSGLLEKVMRNAFPGCGTKLYHVLSMQTHWDNFLGWCTSVAQPENILLQPVSLFPASSGNEWDSFLNGCKCSQT